MSEVTTRFKAERVRSRRHLDRIKNLPCCIPLCRRGPVDPHHLKCGPEGGGTVRASDIWAVPLCRMHHDAAYPRSVHSGRDLRDRPCSEVGWWAAMHLNPLAIARAHAEASRALGILR